MNTKRGTETAVRISRLREAGGLSARELGRLCGFAHGYIGMLERGDRRNPGESSLRRIAHVLGCQLAWLVNGEGKEPSARAVKAAVAAAQQEQDTDAA